MGEHVCKAHNYHVEGNIHSYKESKSHYIWDEYLISVPMHISMDSKPIPQREKPYIKFGHNWQNYNMDKWFLSI